MMNGLTLEIEPTLVDKSLQMDWTLNQRVIKFFYPNRFLKLGVQVFSTERNNDKDCLSIRIRTFQCLKNDQGFCILAV